MKIPRRVLAKALRIVADRIHNKKWPKEHELIELSDTWQLYLTRYDHVLNSWTLLAGLYQLENEVTLPRIDIFDLPESIIEK